MRTHSFYRRRPAGSILVIALVIIAVVTVGFSAWVGLLSQRGRSAEVEEHAARRRISSGNSRAVIREYALERMLTSSGDADGITIDPMADGFAVTSAGAWTGYPMESTTRLAGLNGFSFAWDYPYSKVIDTTAATKALGFNTTPSGRIEQSLSDTASYLKTYVRSRSPVLGGDLLVVHRSKQVLNPEPVVTGNITVSGRVMHFRPDLAQTKYTAQSIRFIGAPGTANVRPKDLSGSVIPPTNMAWTPVSFGRVSGITDFSGKLNVIDDSSNGGNSLRQRLETSAATIQNGGGTALNDPRGYVNDGAGKVTITSCVGSSNPADLPSVVINDAVSELIIEGQTGTNFTDYARYRPAIAVTYVQSDLAVRKLATIRLRKQNSRRMVLALKHSGLLTPAAVNVIVEDTNATSEWHLVILAENMPLTITANSPVTTIKMVGGIQTDASLTGPGTGKTLALSLEEETRGLIRLMPRAAWVETIMPDKIPNSTLDNTW